MIFLVRLDFGLGGCHAAFERFKVGKDKFEIDGFYVASRIYTAVNVRDVGIVKASDNMHNRIHFSYVRQKFVAKTFSAACTLDKTCDVHKFKRSRSDFLLS